MQSPTKRARLDLETSSTCSSVPELSPDVPEELLEQPRFYHFKIKYDQSWDYPDICKKFFMQTQPYLCIIEHLNEANTHVHFQGMSIYAERTVKARLNRLARQHHLRKFSKGCRPCSMRAREPDVVGYQYMCKEVKPEHILDMNMFTMEDIFELKKKSTMHVKELMCKIIDLVRDIPKSVIDKWFITKSTTPDQVIKEASRHLIARELRGEIKLPKYHRHHNRSSFVEGLRQNEHIPASLKGDLFCL